MDKPALNTPEGHKDRRGALIGVGILVVAVGFVSVLIAALALAAALIGPSMGAPTPASRIWPGVVLYALLAVAFVWLGIGSMKARRWARSLLLIVSWVWLLTGVVSVAVLAVFLPRVFVLQPSGGPALPEGCAGALTVAVLVVTLLFFVLLPGVLVLFYRSPHVKATCEARDPVARWTDACPPQVLAMSLMLAVGAAFMLLMAVPYHGLFPVFGRFVTGPPGVALTAAVAVLTAYCAWAGYRLDPKGWWVLIVVSIVGTVSGTLTLARTDVFEVYRLMGYTAEEVATLRPILGEFGGLLPVFSAVNALIWLGYLLYVKKYFRRA